MHFQVLSNLIGVCYAQTHKLSQMDMQPVRLESKTTFSQSISKFGLGDRKKCIRKELEEAQSHFLPRSPEIWICGWEKWKKSVWKEREITLVRARFFPWRAKIRIWGWENVKNIYLKSVKSKYSLVVYKTRVWAHPPIGGFAPTLVLYTTMMMKQYHLKHFYANLDFDHFPWNFMKKKFEFQKWCSLSSQKKSWD